MNCTVHCDVVCLSLLCVMVRRRSSEFLSLQLPLHCTVHTCSSVDLHVRGVCTRVCSNYLLKCLEPITLLHWERASVPLIKTNYTRSSQQVYWLYSFKVCIIADSVQSKGDGISWDNHYRRHGCQECINHCTLDLPIGCAVSSILL